MAKLSLYIYDTFLSLLPNMNSISKEFKVVAEAPKTVTLHLKSSLCSVIL
jgi:hypothetical protein